MKNKIIFAIGGVIALVLIVGGVSYAWLSWASTTAQKTNISSSVASVLFEDGTAINVTGLSPVMDASKGTVAKNFTVKTTTTTNYNVSLKTTSISASLAGSSFKCILQRSTDNSTFTNVGSAVGFNGQAANSTLAIASNQSLAAGTYYFRLVFYIDGTVSNDASMMGAAYKGQLMVTTS